MYFFRFVLCAILAVKLYKIVLCLRSDKKHCWFLIIDDCLIKMSGH